MTSLSERLRPQSVLGISLSVAAVGLIGYAAYFDHQRRHNPSFRRRLLRQQSKLDKSVKADANRRRTASENEVRRRLEQEDIDGLPATLGSSPESQETYFLEQVGHGEQLVMRGPSEYAAAAIHFFKALKVYPAPHELLNIYQKEVFDLVMLALQEHSTGRRGGAGLRTASSDGPIIEEIVESVTVPSSSASGARRSGNASSASSSPTGNGNGFVQVSRSDAATPPPA